MLRNSLLALVLLLSPASAFAAEVPGSDGATPYLARPDALLLTSRQVLSVSPGFNQPRPLGDRPYELAAVSPSGQVVAVGPTSIGLGRIDGTVTAARSLDGQNRPLAAAIDDRGDAVVIDAHCHSSCATVSIRAFVRRAGHRFVGPTLLAGRTYRATAAGAALNERGDALVAWAPHRPGSRVREVLARLRTAAGHWTRTRRLGPTAPIPTFALTLTPAGTGVVGWYSQGVSEGSVGSAGRVYASTLTGPLHRLEAFDPIGSEGTAVAGARVRAVLRPNRTTLFAWTGRDAGHFVVRAARFGRSAGTLSAAGENAELTDLAAGPGDRLAAVWQTGYAGTDPDGSGAYSIQAATGAGGAFGAPITVTRGSDPVTTGVGALDDRGGLVVAWAPKLSPLGGQGGPVQYQRYEP